MGYSTDFKGELKFKNELTAKQLAKIKSICGEDCRDHPEWNAGGLTHMDIELNDDFSGLRWNGSEKTDDLVEKVNYLVAEICKEWPDFRLAGELHAQGEDFDDRWVLKIDGDGFANRREIVIVGEKVQCPHCHAKFILEAASGA